jgi:N4-gp56 family major capsid protein
MEPTTRTQIPAENQSFYNRTLLDRSVPFFTHGNWAQVRDIQGGSGTNTAKFRKYGNLAAQTTPLVEGVTPSGKQLSTTDITATVQYYGDYVLLTDVVQLETLDPILTETAEILGDQAGDSVDQLMRDVMAAGTNVQYPTGAAARNQVTAAMTFASSDVKKVVRTLKNNLARPITSRIDPNTGYNTVPLKASFIAIMHPNTTFTAEDQPGWTPVEKYANKNDVMPNEVGSFPYVRCVETTNAKIFTAAGSGSIDVYATLIFGANAYAMTRLSTLTMKNIIKPLGSAGAADPLDQRGTSGWKLSFVGKILQQPWIVRYEHAVAS